MIARAAYLTPMLHVADVRRSITFYRLLGLELMDYEGDPTCCSHA
jgi:catechol 2,3-dioxygenase-like lactoylglutathione lyase family enzyme